MPDPLSDADAATPEPLRLSRWLPYRLFIIAAHIARPLETFYSERFGLTQAAWRILATIAERSGASASEIGRACALESFVVSRGIALLVSRGFAVRSTARADRRFAAVEITAAGIDAFGEIARLGRVIESDLLSVLDDAERDAVADMLRRMEDASARIEADGWRALAARGAP